MLCLLHRLGLLRLLRRLGLLRLLLLLLPLRVPAGRVGRSSRLVRCEPAGLRAEGRRGRAPSSPLRRAVVGVNLGATAIPTAVAGGGGGGASAGVGRVAHVAVARACDEPAAQRKPEGVQTGLSRRGR